MADRTKIEWTDATWNPIVGCSVLSPGCTNCYAMRLAGTWLKHHPSRAGLTIETKAGPVWTGETRLDEKALMQPLHWRRPRKIFVGAHTDLFHPSTPDAWIDRVFASMALAPQHTFQVLTKRPERMRKYILRRDDRGRWPALDMAALMAVTGQYATPALDLLSGWPLANCWLGVTAERQQEADERIPILLDTPAAKRFVSVEPMLGAVHLGYLGWPNGTASKRTGCSALTGMKYVDGEWVGRYPKIDWVICGGESGPRARPRHPQWARSLRDQCAAAGVPYFDKQHGEWAPLEKAPSAAAWSRAYCARNDGTFVPVEDYDSATCELLFNVGKRAAGRLLDGVEHNEFPEVS